MTIDQIALALLAFTCGFLWAKLLGMRQIKGWWWDALGYLALMLWMGGMMSVGLFFKGGG